MPEVNEEFAQSIREGLTLEELTREVEKAVMEETGTSKRDTRNKCVVICDAGIPEDLTFFRRIF